MIPWFIAIFAVIIAGLVLAAYRRRADALVASQREEHQGELRAMETEVDARVRRLEREAESSRHDTRDELVRDLLPVLDSLDNGIAATRDVETRKGLGLVRDEFVKALQKQGVDVFKPRPGEGFDPELHEAVDVVEAPELPAGAVSRALRAGARSRDRVLRPALVAVTREALLSQEPSLQEELDESEEVPANAEVVLDYEPA